jgi:hypothetical protein
MHIIYVNTKFQTRSTNDSLPIAIKTTSKYTFHAAAILFYILHTQQKLHKNCIFFEDFLPYVISGPYINPLKRRLV